MNIERPCLRLFPLTKDQFGNVGPCDPMTSGCDQCRLVDGEVKCAGARPDDGFCDKCWRQCPSGAGSPALEAYQAWQFHNREWTLPLNDEDDQIKFTMNEAIEAADTLEQLFRSRRAVVASAIVKDWIERVK